MDTERIDALIEQQQALTSAIADLAASIALLAQAMTEDEPEPTGGTLDD